MSYSCRLQLHMPAVCMYVCMSFIFRKSFTRYGNSHITNNKKHSNIKYHIYLVERKFVGNKK